MSATENNIYNVTMAAAMEERMFSYDLDKGSDRTNRDAARTENERREPVKLSLSQDAKMLIAQMEGDMAPPAQVESDDREFRKPGERDDKDRLKERYGKKKGEESATTDQLSEAEREEVEELRRIDREVRSHEQSHVAAAGRYYSGGPYFEYEVGPDGQRYAVGGHVDIDVGEANTPEETLEKAQVVKSAALAAGNASPADQAIAARASAMEAEARTEIAEEESGDSRTPTTSAGKMRAAYDPYEDIPLTGVIIDKAG